MQTDEEAGGGTQPPLKAGSLVTLLPGDTGDEVDGSLRFGNLGRVVTLVKREADGALVATVEGLYGSSAYQRRVVQLYGQPAPTAYDASRLRVMNSLEVAALCAEPEDGYESYDEVVGQAERPAFAQLCNTDSPAALSPQLLARVLWNCAWKSQTAGGCRRALVQVESLAARDGDTFTADLRVFLPANLTSDAVSYMGGRVIEDISMTVMESLLWQGSLARPGLRALSDAFRLPVPVSAASLLALGARAQDGSCRRRRRLRG